MANEEHCAKVGLFVEVGDKVYALINTHVSRNCFGEIKIQTESSEYETLTDIRQGTYDNVELEQLDACLLKVNPQFRQTWSSLDYKQHTIYNKGIETIYGCNVVKLRRQVRRTTENVLVVENKQTADEGVIIHESDVKHNKFGLGPNKFMVCGHGKSFAKPGESGTAIGLVNNETGATDAVGILCGKIQEADIDNKQFIVCTFLPAVLQAFETNIKTYLKDSSLGKIIYVWISGETISFQTPCIVSSPEAICQQNFEIADKLEQFVDCLDFSNVDISLLKKLRKAERDLRTKVFQRKFVESVGLFEPDAAEQRALLCFYLSNQFLYGEKLDQAGTCLKEGLRMIGKTRNCSLRLVCKALTRTTWYYLDVGDNEQAKRVLDLGLKFSRDNKDKHMTATCLPYVYYDYARYHDKLGRPIDAIDNARKAFEQLKEVHKKAPNKTTSDRLSMVGSLYVTMLLQCGEDFQRRDNKVDPDHVEKAEETLEYIQDIHGKFPCSKVQQVEYLLGRCDLLYRKEQFKNAKKTASLCIARAKYNDMESERKWAETRLHVLEDKIMNR